MGAFRRRWWRQKFALKLITLVLTLSGSSSSSSSGGSSGSRQIRLAHCDAIWIAHKHRQSFGLPNSISSPELQSNCVAAREFKLSITWPMEPESQAWRSSSFRRLRSVGRLAFMRRPLTERAAKQTSELDWRRRAAVGMQQLELPLVPFDQVVTFRGRANIVQRLAGFVRSFNHPSSSGCSFAQCCRSLALART